MLQSAEHEELRTTDYARSKTVPLYRQSHSKDQKNGNEDPKNGNEDMRIKRIGMRIRTEMRIWRTGMRLCPRAMINSYKPSMLQ